jgi:site-specific DNA recombinase
MNAAIYARKSTAQDGKADDAKSVPTQIAGARKFIASKGWVLNDAHIYSDKEISGAEFERRPGFQQLLASALQRKPPFQVLVVRELARLGRESAEVGYVIKQLAQAGVEIIEYIGGKSLTPKNWMEKAMSGEAHREQSSILVHAAHVKLHEAGKVVGGRVFGYRNVHIYNGVDQSGNPLFSHVERVRDEAEAAVVQRIFEMADSGYGLKRIAKVLNADGAPEPKHYRRADGLEPYSGWAPSTIRGVLTRETYRGIVIWNKTRKKDSYGQWKPTDRPESEWIRTTNKDLRIIDEALWQRVAARRRDVEGKTLRFESGRMCGRPPKNATVNLGAGLFTCGVCGGGLVAESGGNKRGRVPEYICNRRRVMGECTNTLRIPVEDMNEAVLIAIEEHALTPEAIEQIIELSESDDARDGQKAVDRERKDVAKRIERLVAAIEATGHSDSLVAKLHDLETRQKNIEAASLRPVPRLAPAVISSRLAEWRRLLRASTTTGRTVLQRILDGRITFQPRPDGNGYDFTAQTRFDKLFAEVASPRPVWIPKGGSSGIENPHDADYGQLLDGVKGWCARRDLNPRPTGSKPAALSN